MEKNFKCNLCGKVFGCSSNLNTHIRGRHEGIRSVRKRNTKCNMCDSKFSTKQGLMNHVRTHTGERPFKCAVTDCGMTFKQEKALDDHIKNRHSDKRPFQCEFPGCLYTAKISSSIKRHKQVHRKDWSFACPQTGCNFGAKLKKHILSHLASFHKEAKPFACSKCEFQSYWAVSLDYHMRRHSSRRDFKCSHPQCAETFKRSLDLKRHFSNRHGERNLYCDHHGCGQKYANVPALNKHKRRTHSVKKYTCRNAICTYRTNDATNLARHMIVHDGRNEKIPCSIEGCEYKGKNKRAVEEHMRRHKTFLRCPISGCTRYATTKDALNKHVKLHNNSDRPFQCPLCFKNYPNLFQLQTHCVVHTNEKPLKCGYCDYSASHRSSVKTHISLLHGNNFPFIVLPLDDRECLRCKVILPAAEFLVHSMAYKVPVVVIERLETTYE